MGGCVVGWVGQWVESGQMTKNLINLDLIEILQFVWRFMICKDTPPMGGCVGGWVGQWVGSGQMINNWINLDLIETIQFCVKSYDL